MRDRQAHLVFPASAVARLPRPLREPALLIALPFMVVTAAVIGIWGGALAGWEIWHEDRAALRELGLLKGDDDEI